MFSQEYGLRDSSECTLALPRQSPRRYLLARLSLMPGQRRRNRAGEDPDDAARFMPWILRCQMRWGRGSERL